MAFRLQIILYSCLMGLLVITPCGTPLKFMGGFTMTLLIGYHAYHMGTADGITEAKNIYNKINEGNRGGIVNNDN